MSLLLLFPAQDQGAMSGQAGLSFSVTGDIAGAAALSGSSGLSFTTAGSLSAVAVLSGAASAAFTTSAAITSVAGASGHADAAITTSGNLAADAALSGSASSSFSTSAGLDATAWLSGSSEVVFSAAGSLDADGGPSEAALFGTVSLAFVASGDLSVSGGEVADLGGLGAHKPAHVPAYAGDYRYWLEQKRKLEGVIRQLEKARAAPQSAVPITAAIERAEDISDRLRAAIAAVNESDNRIQQIMTALILARDMHKRMIDEEEEVLLLEML